VTAPQPFEDVIVTDDGFSLPDLKWRELVFIGVFRSEKDVFVRDPTRPMPPFKDPDLFPEGCRFGIRRENGRVFLKRL
jgi:hypothetical protein